jgi:serine/threonine-protein kinase
VPSGALEEHVGRVLGGRYRIVHPIGSGASAQVYLADDTTLRRRVAVKILHRALADDEAFLRRFRHEAQAAAALNHPNIVSVYDWGEDGYPYIVSEYLAGGSLRGMLDAGLRLTPSQALVVGLAAARALEHAHRKGFVHRDVKPDNLLFDEEGLLRLADLGLARALAEAAWTEPEGTMLGTVRYASPEQAKGLPLDGRSDVYALALVLHEAVTGEVPFLTDSTLGTLMARVDAPFPEDERLGALGAAVRAAGNPDPAERPDATALVTTLMACASKLPRPEALPLVGTLEPGTVPDDRPDLRTELAAGPDRLVLPGAALPGSELLPGAALPGTTVSAEDLEALADEDAPEVDAFLSGAGDDAAAPAEPRRRRRRFRRVLVAVLGLVLLAGAGVGAWFAWDALADTSVAVPTVLGEDEAAATLALQDAGLEVEVLQGRLDDSLPGEVILVEPAAGEKVDEGSVVRITVSLGNELRPVPTDLAGLSLPEAQRRIEQAELVVGAIVPQANEEIPVDFVVGVTTTDAELPRDAAVDLVVSSGPAPRVVPTGLEGQPLQTALDTLTGLRLVPTPLEEFSADVPSGAVIRLEPAPGTELAADTPVTVVVSKGPEPKPFPSIIGLSVDQAESRLAAIGVSISTVTGPPNGQVTGSSILAGELVLPGTTVALTTR